MNILVICDYGLYRNLASSFVHAQAKEFARQGHRVRAVIPVPVGKCGPDGRRFGAFVRQERDGVTLLYVRFLSLGRRGRAHFNTARARCALRRYSQTIFEGFQPDVIHAHTLGFDSDLGTWLKETAGCPLVVTSHGSDASAPYEEGRLDFLRRCCDKADTVVAVSSALAEKLRESGTATPIRTILNGFDHRGLPAPAEKTPCSFLQAGNLNPQKRFDTSLRAFAAVRQCHPDAAFTVVGQGNERPVLEALCEELGIESAVRFTGQIPNRTLLKELSGTRFFVMPSVREGFGIVYLEAMASGCVTIGTEGEGIADLIVHGENGFLVPPDDPAAIVKIVEWCLDHPEEADTIARRGQSAALSLTWEVNATRYIALFQCKEPM